MTKAAWGTWEPDRPHLMECAYDDHVIYVRGDRVWVNEFYRKTLLIGGQWKFIETKLIKKCRNPKTDLIKTTFTGKYHGLPTDTNKYLLQKIKNNEDEWPGTDFAVGDRVWHYNVPAGTIWADVWILIGTYKGV
jgi:hypothetical protein